MLLVMSYLSIYSQPLIHNLEQKLFINNYSVGEGLSEANVNTIFRDSRGLVWLGTDGGLNRFNGYDFEVYKSDTSEYSLSSDIIYAIVEDREKTLWVGATNGLNEYLPDKNAFGYHLYGLNTSLLDISYDSARHALWLAMMHNGLVMFDIATKSYHASKILPKGLVVRRVVHLGADSLAIGTQDSGVYLMNSRSCAIRRIHTQSAPLSLSHNMVRALMVHGDMLVVGTDKGLNLLRPHDSTSVVFSKAHGNFSSDLIVCLERDASGNIWVGTDGGGINVINASTGVVTHFEKNYYDNHQLRTNVIREIFVDGEENIWIGTYKQGFGLSHRMNAFIRNLVPEVKKYEPLVSQTVASFQVKDEKTLYVGTDGSGLLEWNGRVFGQVPVDPQCPGCRDQKILCMEKDDHGGLWMGTYSQGVYYLGSGGRRRNFLAENTPGLNSNYIWAIKKDAKGNVWLATESGLTRVAPDFTFRTFEPVNTPNRMAAREMRSLEFDSHGNLWVGTFYGVFVFDPEKEVFGEHYFTGSKKASLPGNMVLSVKFDSKGLVWIGTYGQGLLVIDPKSGEQALPEIQHAIGKTAVHFIQEDGKGVVWIGTNQGIVAVSREPERVCVFNENNGLQDNIFNTGAAMLLSDSVLIAGSVNGFSLLNTYQLMEETVEVPVLLERVLHRSRELALKRDDSGIPVFEMDYGQASLTFDFSAPDFFKAKNIRYSCYLENFDADWSFPASLRQAVYTNLPPGKYRFCVKTYPFFSQGSGETVLATVFVKPAWWMKPGIRLVFFAVALLFIFAVVKLRSRRLEAARRNLLVAVKEQTSEIARQKEELNKKNFEIKIRNDELLAQNEELLNMNEELNTQKETIDEQRESLEKAHQELKTINEELEKIVQCRTQELNETIDELNKTISELDRFVYSASHDLGAPLKSILGLINIARLETRDDNILPHLQFMTESVQKLEEVIKNLIEYSRNSRMDITLVPITLSRMVTECFDALKFMPGYEDIRLYNSLPPSLTVISDEKRMKIILRNLLSNAVKYSDKKKSERWIKVSHMLVDEQCWRLTVEDNGVGIPEDQLEDVFKMFYRANENVEGSGLGLYITKEAISKLNGEILVKSKVGKGTIIHLTFPLPG